ncbi:hypothetical protein GCM10023229_16120 [Flavisolibacter ginsenosidimutans]
MPQLQTPVPFAAYDFLNRKAIYSHSDMQEEGSFLFPQQASVATIKLKNGRLYTNLKAMVNLLDNELLFQDSLGQNYSAVVPIDFVEFNAADNDTTKTVFKTGFPATDGFTENTFYEVLSEGSLTLLKAYKVSYVDRTSIQSSVPIRRYDTKEMLYVYDKQNGIRKISKNKKEILETLTGKTQEVSVYVSSHKTNFKSEKDLAGLFIYYNQLLSSGSH